MKVKVQNLLTLNLSWNKQSLPQTHIQPIKLKWPLTERKSPSRVGSWAGKRRWLIKMRYYIKRTVKQNRVEIMKSWWAREILLKNYSFSSIAIKLHIVFFMKMLISFVPWLCLALSFVQFIFAFALLL